MKTMILLVGMLGLVGTDFVQADQPRGPRGPRINTVDREDLGALNGELKAWERGFLQGGDLVAAGVKPQEIAEARRVYQTASSAYQKNFLGEEQFGEFGSQFVEIVSKAKEEGPAGFAESLQGLKEKTMGQVERATNSALATPRVNQRMLTGFEMMWFGVETGKLSEARAASFTRKLGLVERDRVNAGKDEQIDEGDRSDLMEDANEIVKDLVKALAH